MNRILTILDVELAREFYARGFWKGDTLYAVLSQHAVRAPDRIFLRDTDSCLTYREVLRWVDAIAQDLSAEPLKLFFPRDAGHAGQQFGSQSL